MTSLMLSAAEISQEQALANARSFILQKSGGSLVPKRVQRSMNMQAIPTGMPELYAFNIEGGGYVIASSDLHLVVMLGYNDYIFTKLLDLNIKPGTTVTSEEATAISTIDAPDADAPFYDLQGRRVSHPRKGIYIRNAQKNFVK